MTIGPVLIAVAVLTAIGKDATGIQFGSSQSSAIVFADNDDGH